MLDIQFKQKNKINVYIKRYAQGFIETKSLYVSKLLNESVFTKLNFFLMYLLTLSSIEG